MKKLFLVLLMGLFFSMTFAQDEPVAVENGIESNVTTAERIVDKYSDKVSNTVNSIVDGLKEPAKEVFESVVMLQIAKGVALLLLLIPTIIFWVIFGRLYKGVEVWLEKENNYNNTWDNNTWDNAPRGTFTIISLCSAIAFTIGSVFSTYWGLLFIFAPKWFAILELVNLVK